MDGERTRLLKLMEKLARCKANDAVKLAFPEGNCPEWIDKLDLTALTGFKRSDKGGVEILLMDRMAALKLLAELSAGQEEQRAAEFFQAWERRAAAAEQEEV